MWSNLINHKASNRILRFDLLNSVINILLSCRTLPYNMKKNPFWIAESWARIFPTTQGRNSDSCIPDTGLLYVTNSNISINVGKLYCFFSHLFFLMSSKILPCHKIASRGGRRLREWIHIQFVGAVASRRRERMASPYFKPFSPILRIHEIQNLLKFRRI